MNTLNDRRSLIPGLIVLLLPFFAHTAEQSKPNVLFIAVDDLRADLGCYGHPLVQSPNIDQLAKRGRLFQHAYCQQALCNPSRASLMTGLRPDTLQLWNLVNHFRDTHPKVITLPQCFKQHGYHTQNIGKVFHNWRTEIKGDPKSWSVPAVMHYATHGSDTAKVDGKLPPSVTKAQRTEARDVPDDAYFDGRIANLAIDALREVKDLPFFLAIGFWKPHLPFNAPKKYWDLYKRKNIKLPANPYPPKDVPKLALHNGRELLGTKGRQLSSDEIRELRHGYYAAISYLDAQIGKVLTELKRLDLEKKTIIVFWSDHGFHLGEHQLWCKTSNFELDARVPMIITTPKMKSTGKKSKALVELLDLYPTLTDLCGLPAPKGLEGISLKPILENPTKTVKPGAFTQHPRPAYYKGKPEAMGYSVRTERYRYTEWRSWKNGKIIVRELYDHQHDPHENRNIIATAPDSAAIKQAVELLRNRFSLK